MHRQARPIVFSQITPQRVLGTTLVYHVEFYCLKEQPPIGDSLVRLDKKEWLVYDILFANFDFLRFGKIADKDPFNRFTIIAVATESEARIIQRIILKQFNVRLNFCTFPYCDTINSNEYQRIELKELNLLQQICTSLKHALIPTLKHRH